MSAKFRKALSSVPQTKPSCPAIVIQLTVESVKFHSTRNAGTTADALNHSDMPSNSASESSTSVRQRPAAGESMVFVLTAVFRESIGWRKEYYKNDRRYGLFSGPLISV